MVVAPLLVLVPAAVVVPAAGAQQDPGAAASDDTARVADDDGVVEGVAPLGLVLNSTALVIDEVDDAATVQVSENAGTYTVRLSRAPVVGGSYPTGEARVWVNPPAGAAHTVRLSGPGGANRTNLTFDAANWDTPQTITVTAVNDEFYGDRSVVLGHSGPIARYCDRRG